VKCQATKIAGDLAPLAAAPLRTTHGIADVVTMTVSGIPPEEERSIVVAAGLDGRIGGAKMIGMQAADGTHGGTIGIAAMWVEGGTVGMVIAEEMTAILEGGREVQGHQQGTKIRQHLQLRSGWISRTNPTKWKSQTSRRKLLSHKSQ
jgi:hypothetical protein